MPEEIMIGEKRIGPASGNIYTVLDIVGSYVHVSTSRRTSAKFHEIQFRGFKLKEAAPPQVLTKDLIGHIIVRRLCRKK